jgi:hypothetical protein
MVDSGSRTLSIDVELPEQIAKALIGFIEKEHIKLELIYNRDLQKFLKPLPKEYRDKIRIQVDQ